MYSCYTRHLLEFFKVKKYPELERITKGILFIAHILSIYI